MSPKGNGDGLSEVEEAVIGENGQPDDQEELTSDDKGQEDERADDAGDDGQEDDAEEADVLTILVRIGHRLGYCENDISTID